MSLTLTLNFFFKFSFCNFLKNFYSNENLKTHKLFKCNFVVGCYLAKECYDDVIKIR